VVPWAHFLPAVVLQDNDHPVLHLKVSRDSHHDRREKGLVE